MRIGGMRRGLLRLILGYKKYGMVGSALQAHADMYWEAERNMEKLCTMGGEHSDYQVPDEGDFNDWEYYQKWAPQYEELLGGWVPQMSRVREV